MTLRPGGGRAGYVRRAMARHRRGAHARGPELGATLVEVLITVWIMGAVMTALCGALMMTVKSSDSTRRATLAETELRRYAEAVRIAPYEPCALPGTAGPYYAPPNYVADAAVTRTVVGVTYWSGSGTTYAATCTVGGANDTGLQRIQVKVVTTGTPALERSTTITKRDTSEGAP